MAKHETSFERRKRRVRTHLKSVSTGRLRLSVYRSNMNIYAQIIDDKQGITLASASTLDSSLSKAFKNGGNKASAAEVGKLIAQRAKQKGIESVVFDRGGYVYHGRIAVLADAARESGLNF